MSFTRSSGGDHCSAMGTASGNPVVATGTFTLRVVIPGRSEWSTCLDLEASVDGQRILQQRHCGEPVDGGPAAQRMQAWRQSNPRISTPDPVLCGAMEAGARSRCTADRGPRAFRLPCARTRDWSGPTATTSRR
ncbi:hypothetical protein GCM10010464_28850 [Pseudonocardia yunnanensis]|uniref:Uncharacterized protein n=1 Tax=Pseudonocardia yunnanensis TaxID=58107 RepID=A0ABW4F084_9PSEU